MSADITAHIMIPRYDIDSLDNRDPAALERVYRWLCRPYMRYFRATVAGLHNIPEGAALYVGNHSSGVMTPDSFIFCGALYEACGLRHLPYGLAHEVAISLPGVHQFIVPLGAVRASHDNARRLFRRGAKVLVYPGGDLDAMRPFSQRHRVVFGGRQGYMALALRHGVPIVPVVAAGSHATFVVLDQRNWLELLGLDRLLRLKVWPTTFSLPWGLTPGPPPLYLPLPVRIRIQVLPPIHFSRSGHEAATDGDYVARCAAQVERTMQRALSQLAQPGAR